MKTAIKLSMYIGMLMFLVYAFDAKNKKIEELYSVIEDLKTELEGCR